MLLSNHFPAHSAFAKLLEARPPHYLTGLRLGSLRATARRFAVARLQRATFRSRFCWAPHGATQGTALPDCSTFHQGELLSSREERAASRRTITWVQVLGRQYETFFLDIARIAIAVVKDIYAEKRHYEVKFGKKFLETVDWSDIDLEEDMYSMQCFPISAMSQEPSARWQQVQEWVQAGWLDPRTARQLMNFPPGLRRIYCWSTSSGI